MPELPEVETTRRGLADSLEGQLIERVTVRERRLRQPIAADFEKKLAGRRLTRLERRAKYLLGTLDSGAIWVCHLGMSGSFRLLAGGNGTAPGRHDHVVLDLGSGHRLLFNDPRRFGLMMLIDDAAGLERHPLFRHLGPEPLGNRFNGPALAARLKGRRGPVKSALLDQKVVAGIGNIYASEALYRAAISPRRRAATIAGQRAERLARAIRAVLAEAIEAGGSSIRDHARVDGTLGYFQHAFQVYDRAGRECGRAGCGGIIRRIVQSGRASFYCPGHQR